MIADRGTVRVLGGTVSGGNAILQFTLQNPGAPLGTARSAIAANGSTIEISGGLLQASSLAPRAEGPYDFASAVLVSSAELRAPGQLGCDGS